MNLYYLTPQILRNKTVGLTRVINIAETLESLGFDVYIDKIERPDIDVWVKIDEDLVLVIEITNWIESSYMGPKKAESVRHNFRKYFCHKLLVGSFHNNFRKKLSYIDSDVDVLYIGFQTMPIPWYLDLVEMNKDEGRRPDTAETRDIVRRNITAYFEEIGLI